MPNDSSDVMHNDMVKAIIQAPHTVVDIANHYIVVGPWMRLSLVVTDSVWQRQDCKSFQRAVSRPVSFTECDQFLRRSIDEQTVEEL